MGEQPKINRRTILQAGALTGAVGLVLGLEGSETVLPWEAAGGDPKLKLSQTPTFTKAIHRRADQMSIRLEFYNLTLLKRGQPGLGDVQSARLVKVDPAADAFIVVDFGPQHLAEHAYDEVTNEPVPTDKPTKSMLAGSSRLAFKAPAAPIPYTFGKLMAWKDLLPSLAPHATGPAAVRAPLPTETAIEVPWKVVLSPGTADKWVHPMVPVPGPGGRSVLWHARLNPGAKARVIWTSDPENATSATLDPDPPGKTSLQPFDRSRLVKLTSRWDQQTVTGDDYVPMPVELEQLALSAHGAWLKSEGKWETRPAGVDLEEWVHQATFGRDHFVKIVDAGRAWPIRHRLQLIKITERKFEPLPSGKLGAVLRQRFLIVPRDREITYDNGNIPLGPNGFRDLPFKRIRILTKVTPNLAPFELPSGAELGTQVPVGTTYRGRDAFWPRVGGLGNWADFLWELEGEDYEGRVVRFSMPLIYVSETFGRSYGMKSVGTYYASAPVAARRTADFGGQKVALARFAGSPKGETAYPLKAFTFGGNVFDDPTATDPRAQDFTPYMMGGQALLDAVDRIRGGGGGAQAIKLHKTWITDGDSTTTNPSRVFAKLDSPVSLSYKSDATGGVAAPDMEINALSALTGPIDAPGITDETTPTVPAKFIPAHFFNGADPKLFGHIALKDILGEIEFPAPGAMAIASASSVPRLVTTEIVEGNQIVGVHTALIWETTTMKDLLGLFTPQIEGGGSAKLTLAAQTYTYFDGRPASTIVTGDLTNFTIHAVSDFEVLDLLFNRFGFVSKDGKKPDIKVSIHDVQFKGALEFVNVLRQYMGGDGIGGGGPTTSAALATTDEAPANGGYVNITPSGVQAGYNLTLPPVTCGVLLLENISFGARADLYFDGRPMGMRFNFAERNRPFTLTVMCFGGGGSMALTLSLNGFELFEASLEFGAKLALDIGVASGSISAMAGIYLAIGGSGTDTVKLTGFLRLNGELDILGIISMAIEFYLAFTYIDSPESCYGEAKVTVEIEVLFFSASVTLGPIKKTFAGGGDPPPPPGGGMALKSGNQAKQLVGIASSTPKSFEDMTSPAHWAEYTAMFAPAAF